MCTSTPLRGMSVALLEMAFSRGMLKQDEIAVIWTSDPTPGAPIVYRRDLPQELKAKIRASFVQIHDPPWGQTSTIKRWVPTNDAAYDVVRQTAKLLTLDSKKMK